MKNWDKMKYEEGERSKFHPPTVTSFSGHLWRGSIRVSGWGEDMCCLLAYGFREISRRGSQDHNGDGVWAKRWAVVAPPPVEAG